MSITLLLIVVTGLISYQAFNDPSLKNKLLQRPYLEHHHKEYYRLITNTVFSFVATLLTNLNQIHFSLRHVYAAA